VAASAQSGSARIRPSAIGLGCDASVVDASELLMFLVRANQGVGCEEIALRCEREDLETVYVRESRRSFWSAIVARPSNISTSQVMRLMGKSTSTTPESLPPIRRRD
jgi:hypothetical protein